MRNIIVVDHIADWPQELPDIEVVPATRYVMDSALSSARNVKVFNFCRSYRYQSLGYYVSLLAEARGHKPQPGVLAMQDLKSNSMARFVSQELDELIQHSLKSLQSDRFTLSIYFGRNMAQRYDRLCTHLYKEFQCPLLKAQFGRDNEKWTLRSINAVLLSEVPAEHMPFIAERSREFFAGKKVLLPKRNVYRYDMAILHNPDEQQPPSDKKALRRFVKAAQTAGMSVELIQKDDFGRLAEFDALFIRETTNVNHHTYRFARRAAAEGLVVVDDPESILKCTNKVYLKELMEAQNVPIPRTYVIDKHNATEVAALLGYPFVLKKPDSAFSHGVYKISDSAQYEEMLPTLLQKSELLIAQQYVPTDFDWRIGVYNRKPLFACRYFMAHKHWQIVEHKRSGRIFCGGSETIPISLAPKNVVRTALKAANLIGDGLYGVDLKELGKECFVIEINDNPNVDAGVEDQILAEELYNAIMWGFLNKIERKKSAYRTE